MPSEKRWGPAQERDLAIAIILSQAGDRPKYNWEKVTEIMTKWGHQFTRDAINQHWSKRVMKEFKERHGTDAAKGGLSSAIATPTKDTISNTPVSKRKKAAVKNENADDDDDDDHTRMEETPVKKSRKTKKEPKAEEESEDTVQL